MDGIYVYSLYQDTIGQMLGSEKYCQVKDGSNAQVSNLGGRQEGCGRVARHAAWIRVKWVGGCSSANHSLPNREDVIFNTT